MASIYDREKILLQCPQCGEQVEKRVLDLRTKDVSCTACGTDIPVGNLTDLVLAAIMKQLDSESSQPGGV